MRLMDKIEDIRRKPEHIRLRYVWAMVAISMIFVVAIWFFSLGSSISEQANIKNSAGDLSGITSQLEQQKSSLTDSVDSLKSAYSQNAIDSLQNDAVNQNQDLNNNQ